MPDPEDHGRAFGPTETRDHDLRELRDQLEATFRAELGERLPRMRLALDRLAAITDADARSILLSDLAREAHSVKGGAMVVGRAQIARIAETLEVRFDALAASRNTEGLDVDELTALVHSLESRADEAADPG